LNVRTLHPERGARHAAEVIPTVLPEMLKDHESPKAQRAMVAMLRMKKLDIAELERAFAG
jgi:hypothetical protein